VDNVNAIYDRLNGPMPKDFPNWDAMKTRAFKAAVRMAVKAAEDVPKKRTDSSVKGELYALESFWI
jgi:hypothetical protein